MGRAIDILRLVLTLTTFAGMLAWVHNIMPHGKVADPQSVMMLHACNRNCERAEWLWRAIRNYEPRRRPEKVGERGTEA